MKVSKIIKVGLTSTLCLGLLPMVNMADNVNSNYQQQLNDYNQVVQDNKDKKSKYEADMQKYQEDMIKYQEDMKAYEQALAENAKKEQENVAMKEQYDKDLVKYEQDKAAYDKIVADNNAKYQEALNKYNAAKAEYDKVIAQMEADKDKPGHLSQAVGQGLQFESEPNAIVTIRGNKQTREEAVSNQEELNRLQVKLPKGKTYNVIIEKGRDVVASYTNLTKISYAGTPIARVDYTFSLNPENTNNEGVLTLTNDPSFGSMILNKEGEYGNTSMKCTIRFYDKTGKLVTFKKEYPAVISLSSLNNNNVPGRGSWREECIDYNLQFIPITQSVVSQHGQRAVGGGPIYANEYTNVGNGSGNAFDTGAYGNWDDATSPDFWRVAGAGAVSSGNTITFTNYTHGTFDGKAVGGQWTCFNTTIANNVLPVVPPKPELPVNPIAPILPPRPQYHNIVPPTKPIPPVKPVEPTYAKEVKPVAPQPPVVETPKTGVGSRVAVVTSVLGIAIAGLVLINRNKQV